LFQYAWAGPNYRPFPYELSLAVAELHALTGDAWHADHANTALLETQTPADPNMLRRVAFASRIYGDGLDIETDIARLERAALDVRSARSTRKESNYLSHGLHRFKGKFYPQLARALLNSAAATPGQLVLDPFAGSGTTLVESWLTGVDAIGFDVSPLATLIASTKVALLTADMSELDRQLHLFEKNLTRVAKRLSLPWAGADSVELPGMDDYSAEYLAEACGAPEAASELDSWFPGSVRHKLTVVLRAIAGLSDPIARDFLRVCLSDQVRSVSQQDPKDLRIRRRTEPIQDAPVLTDLLSKARAELAKLEAGHDLLRDYPWRRPRVSAELQDTRTFIRKSHPVLGRRRVDAVVTSPPYATALPYVDTERLSFILLGLLTRSTRVRLEREMIGSREIADRERLLVERQMEAGGLASLPPEVAHDLKDVLTTNRNYPVGFRKRNTAALLYRYCVGMKQSFERVAALMRPGAESYVVLGDSRTVLGDGRSFRIRTSEHVAMLAEQVGFAWERSIPISVTVENLAHVRNAITENQILVLRRLP
jgi:hypothetical protein